MPVRFTNTSLSDIHRGIWIAIAEDWDNVFDCFWNSIKDGVTPFSNWVCSLVIFSFFLVTPKMLAGIQCDTGGGTLRIGWLTLGLDPYV